MDLKPGSRWKSAVCETEVVVVRSTSKPAALECGGHPMIPLAEAKPTDLELAKEHSSGSLAGKRFTDQESGLEILCTKSGAGSVSVGGRAVVAKEAKKLPASD